jgi:hypothetical protein
MPALCSGLSLRSSPEHSASPSPYLVQQAATDGPELTATSGPRLLAKPTCARRPMHPVENPSSRSHSSSPALPTAPAPERRSDVSVCVCVRPAFLPRRSGTPACCSLPSLPVAKVRAADGIPSGDDRRPVRAVAPAAVRLLRQSATPADDTETSREVLPTAHRHAVPSTPLQHEIPSRPLVWPVGLPLF